MNMLQNQDFLSELLEVHHGGIIKLLPFQFSGMGLVNRQGLCIHTTNLLLKFNQIIKLGISCSGTLGEILSPQGAV